MFAPQQLNSVTPLELVLVVALLLMGLVDSVCHSLLWAVFLHVNFC